MMPPWSTPFARIGPVALFICPIGPSSPVSAQMRADWLSPEELSRAASLRNPEDRERTARARAFLRAVLAAHVGVGPAELRLSVTPRGKPFLAGQGPYFNASYARDLAVAVLSDSRAVGVDIEESRRLPPDGTAFAELVQASCRPEESEAILRAADPRRAFLRLWTAKEARMKLTGEGLSLAPRDILVSLREDGTAEYALPRAPAADLILVDDLLPEAAMAVASGPAGIHLLA
jgi:4'-phosphopantetheinyl transferase